MADFLAHPVEEKHLPQLAEFLCAVFGGSATSKLDSFERQWNLNPAWNPKIPRGWIATTAKGNIVAHTTNIPQLYRKDANNLLCCATGNTAVHQDWRGKGLSKIVGRAFLEQQADLLIAVGSTPTAWDMWTGLGMRQLQRYWAEHHIILGSARSLISDELSIPGVGFVGRAIDGSLRYFTKLLKESPTRSLAISLSEGFNEAEDDDIAKCVAQNAAIYAFRSARVLNWLYFSTPFVRANRVVLTARSCNKLVGYLALKCERKRLRLLECRCRDADPEIARQLMWSLHDYMVANRYSLASIWPYSKMISSAIPHMISKKRMQTAPTYCYFSNVGAINENQWDSTPGDGDIFLY